jgi:hypothetical protein
MEAKSKLLDQMQQVLRLKYMNIRTEESDISWVKRCMLFHHKQHSRYNFGGHAINGAMVTKCFSGGMAETLSLWPLEGGLAQIRAVWEE